MFFWLFLGLDPAPLVPGLLYLLLRSLCACSSYFSAALSSSASFFELTMTFSQLRTF